MPTALELDKIFVKTQGDRLVLVPLPNQKVEQIADRYHGMLQQSIGKTREHIEQEKEEIFIERRDEKLAELVWHTLMEGTAWKILASTEAHALRQEVFQKASHARRSGAYVLSQILGQASTDDLFADVPMMQVLKSIAPTEGEWFFRRLQQVRMVSLLRHAERVECEQEVWRGPGFFVDASEHFKSQVFSWLVSQLTHKGSAWSLLIKEHRFSAETSIESHEDVALDFKGRYKLLMSNMPKGIQVIPHLFWVENDVKAVKGKIHLCLEDAYGGKKDKLNAIKKREDVWIVKDKLPSVKLKLARLKLAQLKSVKPIQ